MSEFKPHDYFTINSDGYISRKVFQEHVRKTYDQIRELADYIKQYEGTIDTEFTNIVNNVNEHVTQLTDLYNDLLDNNILDSEIQEKLTQLEQDYAPRLNDLTAQLQQTEKQTREVANRDTNSNSFIAPKKVNKAYMTIIDDDARSQVWDILKPISEEKGIPITLAVPVNFTTGTGLTKEQLLHLQDDLGWEMTDHTYNHLNMRTLSVDELEHETIDSKLELTSWGLDIKNFVAPYGSNDVPNVRKITSKYYNCGAKVGGGVNTRPVKNHELRRVALGTFTDGNNSLDFYKGRVDSAIANNGWLIWMTHVGDASHTEEQTQNLRDVIDYALSKDVEIVNLQDGFEVFGNKVEVEGEYAVTNQGQSFESGKIPVAYDFDKGGNDIIPDYNDNQLSVTLLTSSNKGNAPSNGVLYTFKPSDPKFNMVYSHQFLVGNPRGIYYRDYLTNIWRDWLRMYVGNDYEISITVPTLASMKATVVTGSLPVTTSGKQVIIKPLGMPDEYIWSTKPSGTTIRFQLFNTHSASMAEREIKFLVSVLESNPT